MMKELLNVLALCLALAMLAACGGGNAAPAQGEESTPAAQSAEQSVEQPAEQSVVSQETDTMPAAYQEIIDQYVHALDEGLGMGDMMDAGLNYMLPGAAELEGTSVGYTVMDMDGDGVEELILAANSEDPFFHGMIFECFTLEGEQAVNRFSSAERNRYYNALDGKVLNVGSSSAFLSLWHLTTADGDATVLDGVEYDEVQFPDDPWMVFCNGEWEHVTEDVAEQRIGELEGMASDLELTEF